MAAAKKISINFEREKETKNKQRFKEEADNPQIGILYLVKAADKKLGEPANITLTIEAK